MNTPDLNFPHKDYRIILAKLAEYFRNYPGAYAIVLIGSLATRALML